MFTDYLLLLTVCTNNYNAILRLRIDFCLVSSCFMQKLNSGSMGNLAQVQVLLYLATSQEMVRKKRSSKVKEKLGNFALSQRKCVFFREFRIMIFLPIQVFK